MYWFFVIISERKKFGTPASKIERSKCVRIDRIIILGDSDDQISYLWKRYTRHFQIFRTRVHRYSCLTLRYDWRHWRRRLWRRIEHCSVYLIVCHVTSFAISSSFMSLSISSMLRTLSAFIAVSHGRHVLQSVLIIIIISWLRLM